MIFLYPLTFTNQTMLFTSLSVSSTPVHSLDVCPTGSSTLLFHEPHLCKEKKKGKKEKVKKLKKEEKALKTGQVKYL